MAVTVYIGDGQAFQYESAKDFRAFDSGFLYVTNSDEDTIAVYAPSAWSSVETVERAKVARPETPSRGIRGR